MHLTRQTLRVMRALVVLLSILADRVFAQLYVRGCVRACGPSLRCFGMPSIFVHPGAEVRLGRGVSFYSRPSANVLHLARPCSLAVIDAGAAIDIGDDVSMSGVTLVACKRIRIGNRTMMGAESMIVDTDFHPLDPQQRSIHPTSGAAASPVEIGCDVFIGARAIILKGVHIGDGAVVGAAALVTHDVESGAIVAGNPARCVGFVGKKAQGKAANENPDYRI